MVTETPICNYIMTIYSPNLCKDTAFESVPTPEANKIECRPIISDEQYQKLKANTPEAIDGVAGIIQDHNAQIKIGQVPRQQPHHQTQQGMGAAATGAPGTDSLPTVVMTLEDILGFAKQVNGLEAGKKMKEILAQYEAFSETFKAMLSPEDKALFEDMLKIESDFQDLLSKEDLEKDDKGMLNANLGGSEMQGELTKDATEKELRQAKAPSTPPQHKQETAAAALAGKEQPQKQDNIKVATVDTAVLLEILDAARAISAEEKQKQGQETSEENKERKSNAQAKL